MTRTLEKPHSKRSEAPLRPVQLGLPEVLVERRSGQRPRPSASSSRNATAPPHGAR
jgi:hypothetical protein